MKVAEVPIGNTPNQIWSNLLRKDPRAKRGKNMDFRKLYKEKSKITYRKTAWKMINVFGFSWKITLYFWFLPLHSISNSQNFAAALRAAFHFSSCSIERVRLSRWIILDKIGRIICFLDIFFMKFRKITILATLGHSRGGVRVLKTHWKRHKSRDHNFLHRSYTPIFFSFEKN